MNYRSRARGRAGESVLADPEARDARPSLPTLVGTRLGHGLVEPPLGPGKLRPGGGGSFDVRDFKQVDQPDRGRSGRSGTRLKDEERKNELDSMHVSLLLYRSVGTVRTGGRIPALSQLSSGF